MTRWLRAGKATRTASSYSPAFSPLLLRRSSGCHSRVSLRTLRMHRAFALHVSTNSLHKMAPMIQPHRPSSPPRSLFLLSIIIRHLGQRPLGSQPCRQPHASRARSSQRYFSGGAVEFPTYQATACPPQARADPHVLQRCQQAWSSMGCRGAPRTITHLSLPFLRRPRHIHLWHQSCHLRGHCILYICVHRSVSVRFPDAALPPR
ncbi:hypothetical protein BC834DRAFT_503064 [Gloeopeniophorella convolvens]|nr:hypothetical protein BC834DRAFT_503064 [Gloeopeniophorella convolvens]